MKIDAQGLYYRDLNQKIRAAVDAGKVSADYRNGLLLVTLPKAESARPRQVPITVR